MLECADPAVVQRQLVDSRPVWGRFLVVLCATGSIRPRRIAERLLNDGAALFDDAASESDIITAIEGRPVPDQPALASVLSSCSLGNLSAFKPPARTGPRSRCQCPGRAT